MQHKLTWHGHANFQIASDTCNVLIDPFFEGNPSCGVDCMAIDPPDLILITHDHADHTGQAVEIAKQTGAHIGAIVGTAQRLVEQGCPQEQIINGIGFNIGGTVVHKGVAVTMTQAYHSSESGAPAGYIITLGDGCTLYHAGDTGIFSGMALWGRLYPIDVALLPIGGVFTMDPRQAAMACRLLGAAQVAPMHWGTFPVLEQSTVEFSQHLADEAPETKLLNLAPGQTITLERGADTCGCD